MRKIVTTALTVAALATAGPAAAGQIELSPSIQGAGSIATTHPPTPENPAYFCASSSQEGDVVSPCPAATRGSDAPSTITLQATPSDVPAGHWQFDRWEGCLDAIPDDDLCEITAPDAMPVSSSPIAVFIDTVPPSLVSVVLMRPQGENGRAVSFEMTADEDATYECVLDTGPVTPCSSGTTYLDLGYGFHKLTVWPIDGSDNKGDPVTTQFTIIPPPPYIPPPLEEPVPNPPRITLLIPRVLGPRTVTSTASRRGAVALRRLRVRCPAVTVRCKATVVLKGKLRKRGRRLAIARKRFTLSPSSTVAVRLRLGRRAMSALEARRRLKGTATVTITAPDVSTRKDVAVTLKAPKRKRR